MVSSFNAKVKVKQLRCSSLAVVNILSPVMHRLYKFNVTSWTYSDLNSENVAIYSEIDKNVRNIQHALEEVNIIKELLKPYEGIDVDYYEKSDKVFIMITYYIDKDEVPY